MQEEGETTIEVIDEASEDRRSTCFSPSFGGAMDSLWENLDGNNSEDIYKGLRELETGVRMVDFSKLEKPLPYRMSVAGFSCGLDTQGNTRAVRDARHWTIQ